MCKNQRLLVKYKTFSASHRLAWNVSLFGCYKNKRRMCARVEGRGIVSLEPQRRARPPGYCAILRSANTLAAKEKTHSKKLNPTTGQQKHSAGNLDAKTGHTYTLKNEAFSTFIEHDQ